MVAEHPRQVAIWDADSLFRAGLACRLERSGIATATWNGDPTWVTGPGRRCVVVSIAFNSDLEKVSRLRLISSDVAIVAVFKEADDDAMAAAIRAGATTAIRRAACLAECRNVIATALDGLSLLPQHVLEKLASPDTLARVVIDLTESERDLLVGMTNGETVGALSGRLHYSTRQTHRLLNRLYSKLGAGNRSDAIVRAAHMGLLPPP